MAEYTETLEKYLQDALPRFEIQRPQRIPKEVDRKFPSNEIHKVEPWQDFNYDKVLQQHSKALTEIKVRPHVFYNDKKHIYSPSSLRNALLVTLDMRVGYILRRTFVYLSENDQMEGKIALGYDAGQMAPSLEALRPDLSYRLAEYDPARQNSHAPGMVKVSWRWDTKSTASGKPWYLRKKYQSMMGEIGAHMRANRTRYGFFISDNTFVAIRKVAKGEFQVSDPISWETYGTDEEPRMTVLMAMWYLGMLAANETGEDKWKDDTLEY